MTCEICKCETPGKGDFDVCEQGNIDDHDRHNPLNTLSATDKGTDILFTFIMEFVDDCGHNAYREYEMPVQKTLLPEIIERLKMML